MKHIIALTVILFSISCSKKVKPKENQQQEMIEIYSGNLFGAGEEGFKKENIHIQSEKEWNNFLAKLNSVNNVSGQFKEGIDFSKKDAIIAIDDVRNTGGFSIKINKVINKKDVLEVFVTKKAPGPTDMVAAAIMQPIHIILINKTNKEIVFVEK